MRSLLLIFAVLSLASAVIADEFAEYPYDLDDEIHAKFIFVGFPLANEVPGYPYPPCYPQNVATSNIYESIHLRIVEKVADYLDQHSNGTLRFADDSGILYRYDERQGFDTNDGDPNQVLSAWVAEYEACRYMPDVVFDSAYPFYDQLHEWWSSSECSELYAEILHKIFDEYWIENQLNPFERDDDETWVLYFVFLSEGADSPQSGSWPPGPWSSGVGGMPDIRVVAEAVVDSTGEFYSTLYRNIEGNYFEGSGQNGWNFCFGYDDDPDSTVSAEDAAEANARAILHEFVHTFGITDGPPNLGSVTLSENTYYYGYLHLECQHYDFGEGIPPIADPALQTIPWNRGRNNDQQHSIVDITDRNARSFELRDVRAGGQIVKISLGTYPFSGGEEEYFILAYHAGTGLDDQMRGADPRPIVPSRGVAIWHCIGDDNGENGTADPFVYDLESAMGKWKYGAPNFIEEFVPPLGASAPVGLDEDPTSGYDNYDCWPTTLTPSPGDTNDYRRDYGRYWGDVFDFFRNDLTDEDGAPEDSLSKYNKNEFSFRTNPNTFGYSREQALEYELRLLPQDIENSIVVKIGETVTDPTEGGYVVIDYSPGPWAEIVAPAAGELVQSGSDYAISWNDDFADHITGVDIEYSRNRGHSWTPLVEDYVLPENERSWTWAVPDSAASLAAEGSYLRITYHNSISTDVAVETMPTGFTVSGTPHQAEEIVYPGAGSRLYQGIPDTLRWTDEVPTPWQFALEWRHGDGEPQGFGETLYWTRDPDADEYWAVWTPGTEQVGGDVQLRLKCFSHALMTVWSPWTAAFPIYPLGAAFADSSDVVLESGSPWYDGVPSGAIPMDTNYDGLEDFVVTMAEDYSGDQNGIYVYENTTDISGMRFEYQFSSTLFNGAQPQPSASSVTGGDLDRDGDRDLVVGLAQDVAGTESRQARVYRNDGASGFTDVTNLWFVGDTPLALVSHATILDYDHNGYEDLFLTRPPNASGPGGDRLWENLAGHGGGGPLFVESTAWTETASQDCSAWALNPQRDMLWEVALFQRGENAFRYFEQQRDGTFEEITTSLDIDYPIAACWADIDHEEGLDLVVATRYQGVVIAWDRRNGEQRFTTGSSTIPLSMGWRASGIAALDHDSDGWMDLVVSGQGDDDETFVLMNLLGRGSFEEPMVLIGEAAGIAVAGNATSAGVAAADFDGDRDVDLMVPRVEQSGRVYGSATIVGTAPQDGWIAFDFAFGQTEVSPSVMGSVVVVEHEGEEVGRQILDGGRGVSGQQSELLLVNLPGLEEVDIVTYTIYMPTSTIGPTTASPGETITVSPQLPTLMLDQDAITWNIEVLPDTGLLEWRFTWSTNIWTPPTADRVIFSNCTGCDFPTDTLSVGTPDAQFAVIYQYVEITGEPSYLHEVIWTDQPCHPGCRYEFDVESATTGDPSLIAGSATTRTGKTKVCPQTY